MIAQEAHPKPSALNVMVPKTGKSETREKVPPQE
jgi:hypothetical protein